MRERNRFTRTNTFAFEIQLEVTSALEFSSGELAELMARALLLSDAEGKLFPSVTTPNAGNRINGLSVAATGYASIRRSIPVERRYHELVQRKGRVRKGDRALSERLSQSADQLQQMLVAQRMLISKLRGLARIFLEPSTPNDADRTIASELLTAAEALTEIVNTVVAKSL